METARRYGIMKPLIYLTIGAAAGALGIKILESESDGDLTGRVNALSAQLENKDREVKVRDASVKEQQRMISEYEKLIDQYIEQKSK